MGRSGPGAGGSALGEGVEVGVRGRGARERRMAHDSGAEIGSVIQRIVILASLLGSC